MSLIHVNDAVTFFLERSYQNDEELTVTKLQKLLYYAQGISLAVVDEPLFEEKFHAWDFGPVCKFVYEEFKKPNGKKYFTNSGTIPEQDSDAYKILKATWQNFGKYNASILSQMTHREAPWLDTPRLGLISEERMKHYFKGVVHVNNKSA